MDVSIETYTHQTDVILKLLKKTLKIITWRIWIILKISGIIIFTIFSYIAFLLLQSEKL